MASTCQTDALLKGVSRSFYLTLRVLPSGVRTQIGLAYLLARATDTIADTEIAPADTRIEVLKDFRRHILGERSGSANLGALSEPQARPSERELLARADEILGALDNAATSDREKIRVVLDTITSGQILDLERFSGATQDSIRALASDAELDDYTYRVAGCVGEFWTRICRANLFPNATLDEAGLIADGVRFGKGLQLVNILRDLPKDLRMGRCYIPLESLRAAALQPADLLKPETMERFRPIYSALLDRASAHLDAGWRYTNNLPPGNRRVRLACAWPLLIGARTVALLGQGNVLDASQRIKVSRSEVKSLMFASLPRLPFQAAWDRLYVSAKRGS